MTTLFKNAFLYDCSVPGISTWTIDDPLVEDDDCPPFDALPPLFEITDDALDGLECLVLFPGVLFFLSVGALDGIGVLFFLSVGALDGLGVLFFLSVGALDGPGVLFFLSVGALDGLGVLFFLSVGALDGLECLVLFPGVLFFLSVGALDGLECLVLFPGVLFFLSVGALDGLECLVLFPGVLFFLSVGSKLFKNSNSASSVSFFLTNWSPALDVTGVEEPATSLDLLSKCLVVAPWDDVACLFCALRNGVGLGLVAT